MARPSGDLERGRESYERGDWSAACAALTRAAEASTLTGSDLARLANTAYMLGDLPGYTGWMAAAQRAHVAANAIRSAARCAFWTGMLLLLAGEPGRGGGWIARARRLLADEPDCVEHGYLRLPDAFRCQVAGQYADGAAIAGEAASVAHRFRDDDLLALALYARGHMLIRGGHVRDGLSSLDEAMVAVTSGDVSPIATGIVYCGVILGCQDAHELGRAQEWTAALAEWCARQTGMIAFTGRCHVHRAELLAIEGKLLDALDEARRAAARAEEGGHRSAQAAAAYVQGEVHRIRGAFGAADQAYRRAAELGRSPQPGLALLRLAEGDPKAAATAIRRALTVEDDRVERIRLLPACVEIMLAVDELEPAVRAASELELAAAAHGQGVLPAIAAQARGAVRLAAGDPEGAVAPLREAFEAWATLQAPYETARARVLLAAASRELGDVDGADLELEAARAAFARLAAAPELARLGASGRDRHELTPRELEVLRHVAEGLTNRAIAQRLIVSDRTVDRHVSNILAKFGVSSRAAATAFAYEHHLL